MSIISTASLQALNTNFRGDFQKGLEIADSQYDKVATTVPSSSKSNTYGWLGQFPGFREWIGDRVINDMAAHDYSITNKDWESTVGVKRTDIEDDNIGVYTPMMQEMGRAAKAQPDELIFSLLKAGIATICFDGQNFFDTDHPVYPNVDGTGVAATVANVDSGGAGEYWYLLDTSRPIKPLIFQERKKPVFTPMTSLTDESVFMSNEFRFGVDSRNNVGFGFWQMAYASNQELNATNFNTAYAALQSFKADGGRPLNLNPCLLVVPPTLRAAALEIVKAERNASGATNINENAVDVLVSPWVAQ